MGFIRNHWMSWQCSPRLWRASSAIEDRVRRRKVALARREAATVPPQIPAIYFPDAQELILQRWGEDCRGEPDLAPQHERWLGEWAQKEHGSDFLFVVGYPMEKRPFYTHPNPAEPRGTRFVRPALRGTELVTGGQRLHLYQDYLDAAARKGYKNLLRSRPIWRRSNSVCRPTAASPSGWNASSCSCLGLDNIRLATLFPRDLNRLAP